MKSSGISLNGVDDKALVVPQDCGKGELDNGFGLMNT